MYSRDHPRSRGVYISPTSVHLGGTGSSPLARGLRAAIDVRGDLGRIIPARAGFTSAASPGARSTGDHPRSRGVYLNHLDLTTDTNGSSPLARGLLGAVIAGAEVGGIIPARAGFTEYFLLVRYPAWDHPRSRGVYA